METIKLQYPNIKRCECSISLDGKIIDSNNEYCLCTICRFNRGDSTVIDNRGEVECKVVFKTSRCKTNKCPCNIKNCIELKNAKSCFKKCEPVTRCTSFKGE